ncbi:hypothetical protein GE09DRAFT_1186007 [Coniochaeta sp. 2T2.1]|nr:hypothetical protein GE09DRAFT_1186007 [Coniochaeta sp. 2T2.1]
MDAPTPSLQGRQLTPAPSNNKNTIIRQLQNQLAAQKLEAAVNAEENEKLRNQLVAYEATFKAHGELFAALKKTPDTQSVPELIRQRDEAVKQRDNISDRILAAVIVQLNQVGHEIAQDLRSVHQGWQSERKSLWNRVKNLEEKLATTEASYNKDKDAFSALVGRFIFTITDQQYLCQDIMEPDPSGPPGMTTPPAANPLPDAEGDTADQQQQEVPSLPPPVQLQPEPLRALHQVECRLKDRGDGYTLMVVFFDKPVPPELERTRWIVLREVRALTMAVADWCVHCINQDKSGGRLHTLSGYFLFVCHETIQRDRRPSLAEKALGMVEEIGEQTGSWERKEVGCCGLTQHNRA